jgi:hypothetical protein
LEERHNQATCHLIAGCDSCVCCPRNSIDFAIEEGPEGYKGKKSKAIYKLDGTEITMCVRYPGKDRPKEFERIEDEANNYKLKKQKKE